MQMKEFEGSEPSSDRSNIAVISLGSNMENARSRVVEAIHWLTNTFSNASVSEVYETNPVGGALGTYFNAVARIETTLPLDDLNESLKDYELKAGRTEECRILKKVPIDLDIVIFNKEIVRPWEYSQMFFRKGFESLS